MIAEGFKLEAVGDDAEKASSAASIDSTQDEVDMSSWNASPDAYTFLYNPDLWQEGGLPACYQNLDELVSKLRSKIGSAAEHTILPPTESDKAQSTAAAGSRQETMPDYGAADDEFPQESRRSAQHPSGILGSGDAVPPGFRPPGYGGLQEPFPSGMGRSGGMHMGPDDPLFAGRSGLQHPGRPSMNPPGARYDPIGPPGMPGFNPDDFQRRQGQIHPDMAQPGPGKGTDWDSMFG